MNNAIFNLAAPILRIIVLKQITTLTDLKVCLKTMTRQSSHQGELRDNVADVVIRAKRGPDLTSHFKSSTLGLYMDVVCVVCQKQNKKNLNQMLPSRLGPSKRLVVRYALLLMLCQCFTQKRTAKGSTGVGRQAQSKGKGVVLA